MHIFKYPPEFVARFVDYMNSSTFSDLPGHAKSAYWELHSSALKVHIEGNHIVVNGASGYYVPREHSFWRRALAMPRAVAGRMLRSLSGKGRCRSGQKKLLSYFEAFDHIMSGVPPAGVTGTGVAAWRDSPSLIRSMNELRRCFYGRECFEVREHIAAAYVWWNVLSGYLDWSGIRSVMEIGAGNGNFAGLLFHHRKGLKITIVDLPETLCGSILYLSRLFPSATVCLPNEFSARSKTNADFVFLTPAQIGEIKDDTIDLAVNCCSFQEMTHAQIGKYFHLIQRVCHAGGRFFTLNRQEKTPSRTLNDGPKTPPTNFFADYPWNPKNEDIINEISRFYALVQHEPIWMRLQRIVK